MFFFQTCAPRMTVEGKDIKYFLCSWVVKSKPCLAHKCFIRQLSDRGWHSKCEGSCKKAPNEWIGWDFTRVTNWENEEKDLHLWGCNLIQPTQPDHIISFFHGKTGSIHGEKENKTKDKLNKSLIEHCKTRTLKVGSDLGSDLRSDLGSHFSSKILVRYGGFGVGLGQLGRSGGSVMWWVSCGCI